MRRFGIEWLALKKHRKVYEDIFEHVSKTMEAVGLLRGGIRDLCSKNYEPLDEIVGKVLKLERDADVIARKTMEDLAVSVLTQVDRGDLMNLVFQVEKIAAQAEGLAYRLERAKSLEIDVPEEISRRLDGIATVVGKTVETLGESIRELPASLEQSACMGNEVSALEEQVDVDRRRLLEVLGKEFKKGGDFVAYGVLGEIIGSLETIADDSEDTADLIRILCVKHTSG
jgi:predicted phosphate transport protein (TIGR00153 family)